MVIALFGESCTGKSTLAAALAEKLGARIFSGKDYLRLAKSQSEAEARFSALLRDSTEPIVYVISEKEHLRFLPDHALRVLVTVSLSEIQSRFATRMGGTLPPALAQSLARKHGMFDQERCDLHIRSGEQDAAAACQSIAALVKNDR